MVIFHSYVSLPEGNHHQFIFLITHPFFMPMKFDGFLAPICPIQSPFNLHISPYISLYLHLCWSYPIFYPNFPTQITWFFQHEIPISPWHFHQEWGGFPPISKRPNSRSHFASAWWAFQTWCCKRSQWWWRRVSLPGNPEIFHRGISIGMTLAPKMGDVNGGKMGWTEI